MATQIDLVNRALLQIGARAQVSSITPSDGSTAADAASVLFSPTFQQLARAANWNCLRNQAALSLLQAAAGAPENIDGTSLPVTASPWLYGYALPSDCLRVRQILPQYTGTGLASTLTTFNNLAPTIIPNGGAVPFAVAYSTDGDGNPIQIILTNLSNAQIVYTVDCENPTMWDASFQAAFVSSLAAFLVPALSLNLPMMQMSIQVAEAAIARARAADGNEGVTCMDHLPDWLVARGAGNWVTGYSAAYSAPYDNVAWPG